MQKSPIIIALEVDKPTIEAHAKQPFLLGVRWHNRSNQWWMLPCASAPTIGGLFSMRLIEAGSGRELMPKVITKPITWCVLLAPGYYYGTSFDLGGLYEIPAGDYRLVIEHDSRKQWWLDEQCPSLLGAKIWRGYLKREIKVHIR